MGFTNQEQMKANDQIITQAVTDVLRELDTVQQISIAANLPQWQTAVLQ